MTKDVVVVPDALVLPVHHVETGFRSFSCGVFESHGPAVLSAIHRSSARSPVVFPSEAPNVTVQEGIDEAIFGGIMFNHFGHFLMECIGRLWCANDPDVRHLPIVVQTLWGHIPLSDPDHFVRTILDLLEIDVSRIRVVTAPLRVRRLLVPEQLYGFHCLENPSSIFVDFLRVAQRNILKMSEGFDLPSLRVYVSRSAWQDKSPKQGIIAGSHAFDDFLVKQGWHVIQPETLTFREQLKVYATAEHIVVSEGSAYHSFILLPDARGKISVIMRRPDPWDSARISDQFNGIGRSAGIIRKIERKYSFGQPGWSGVTIIDYFGISQELLDEGTVSNVFEGWQNQKEHEVRKSLRTYIGAIHGEESFLDYLIANSKA